jgi:glycosyltransferase involved in cell wall biosynthesis
MKLAYTTTFDAQDIHNWSGTPYHMSQALIAEGIAVDFIGSLKRHLPRFFKLKQTYYKLIADQRESPRFNITAAKYYSQQVSKQLATRNDIDAIISPLINPIAYLQTDKPIILWTDALYSALVGFYPPFNHHSAQTIAQGNAITSAALARCQLAIFSSEWAAHSACELYGASKEKIRVIPFGANLTDSPGEEEIKQIIKNRREDKIKLLFLAKSWERKGGDIVLAVAEALHKAQVPVELTIVGIQPKLSSPYPSYIKPLGFISKHDPQGKLRLREILSQTDFLFVPSRAEAYGIVFCEANAFAIPCLSSYVGGISTIIKNNINGMTFALDATIDVYCDYIVKTWQDRLQYQALAFSSFNEYKNRLNWSHAIKTLKNYINEVI